MEGTDPSSRSPFGLRMLGPVDERPERLRRRVQVLVTVAIVSANVIGTAVVVVLNVWAIPGPGLLDTSRRQLSIVLAPMYLLVAVVVGGWWGTRQQLSRLSWAVEERVPSSDERRAALEAPAQLLVVQTVLWAAAVVIFGGLAAAGGPGWVVVRTVATVALGGTVTCGYAYLLSETAFRPVAARALAQPGGIDVSTPGLGVRTVLVWVVGTAAPAAGLILVALYVLMDEAVSSIALARTVVVLGGITLAAGLVLLVLATRSITDPLRSLTTALGRVEAGDLTTRIVVYDGTEIGRVQAAFNHMVGGLEERERLRDLFSRHVGDDVARAALDRGAHMAGERCEATALFVDIVGSTTLAEHSSPEAVVAVLNRFFEHIVDAVHAHGGWVNKFEGDAALCVFGPPTGLDDHADGALRAVRDLRHRLGDLATEEGIRAGIGVASGIVIAGNVGAKERYEYTVIGDPVNTAARLTELAKGVDSGAMAAGSTLERASVGEQARWQEVDRVVVRGRTEPTALFTLRP